MIDAPCTGIGAWRRNPDAKWRVRPGALEQRIRAQDEVLAQAAPLVREGGRIAYITCSLLDQENGARVRAFLAAHPQFAVLPVEQMVQALPEPAEISVRGARDAGGIADDAAAHGDGWLFCGDHDCHDARR